MMAEHNSKQAISSHEQRMTQVLIQQRKNISKINKAIKYLDSKDPAIIVKGLNVLTVRTYDTSDSSAVHLESFPEMILSLGCLLDALSPWSSYVENAVKCSYENVLLNHSSSWKTIEMPVDNSRIILSLMNESPLLLTVLNIIRNLSFESANEFLLSSSCPIMSHLIGILIASIQAHIVTEYTQLAFDILVNIGGRIDTSGRKRLQTWQYIDDGRVPEDKLKLLNLLRYSDHMSAISTVQYVEATSLLFPIIQHILSNIDTGTLVTSKSHARFLVVRSLELFSKLASTSENGVALANAPDSLLDTVVSMLCVSYSLMESITPDALMGDPMGRNRPPAVPFLPSSQIAPQTVQQQGGSGIGASAGYHQHLQAGDFGSDIELRDLAVDAISNLCTNSVYLATRMAETPHCIEFLYRIAVSAGSTVTTTSSSYSSYTNNNTQIATRTEGNLKAVQILSAMLSLPEVSEKFFAIRSNLYVASCSDELIADMVCNKAALVYQWVVAQNAAAIASAAAGGVGAGAAAAANADGGLSSHPSGVFSTV